MIGRHDWRAQRNPGQGGPEAITEVCARCGEDRPVYEPASGMGISTALMRGPS
jgi:hypothetical protein